MKKKKKNQIFLNAIFDLAKEWHPTKNISLDPKDILVGSHKKIWWRCLKAQTGDTHDWEAVCKDRAIKGSGCPVCAGRKSHPSNCLEAKYPEIAKEWNYKKNDVLLPSDVMPRSNKKVWWICSVGHEWQANCANRTSKNSGCPYCSGRKIVSSRSIAHARELIELALEWHPTKNKLRAPYDLSFGSAYKAWWRCSKSPSHEWQATCNNRTSKNATRCPFCAGKKKIATTQE